MPCMQGRYLVLASAIVLLMKRSEGDTLSEMREWVNEKGPPVGDPLESNV